MEIRPGGSQFFSEFLSDDLQKMLVEDIRARIPEAPLYTPTMPRTGKSMSVRMTNFGDAGWMSDKAGYRYQKAHPETGTLWPDIPQRVLEIWSAILPDTPLPDVCLCNYYPADAKMGLHQDRDEKDLSIPVLSISLGDTALFRLGQTKRGGPTQSLKLRSGDVMVLTGTDRMAYHGVDRIYPGTSSLLKQGGRINLTLRKAL